MTFTGQISHSSISHIWDTTTVSICLRPPYPLGMMQLLWVSIFLVACTVICDFDVSIVSMYSFSNHTISDAILLHSLIKNFVAILMVTDRLRKINFPVLFENSFTFICFFGNVIWGEKILEFATHRISKWECMWEWWSAVLKEGQYVFCTVIQLFHVTDIVVYFNAEKYCQVRFECPIVDSVRLAFIDLQIWYVDQYAVL